MKTLFHFSSLFGWMVILQLLLIAQSAPNITAFPLDLPPYLTEVDGPDLNLSDTFEKHIFKRDVDNDRIIFQDKCTDAQKAYIKAELDEARQLVRENIRIFY
jgi:hypothetical protein